MNIDSAEEQAFARVRAALVRVDSRISRRALSADTSLIDDLGLDSIRFVDLAIALEDAFELNEFPLQDWYDVEAMRAGKRFTVGSLVLLCLRLTQTVEGTTRT